MINYKGWKTPEGNVVEVKDASGVVIWAVQSDKPIILEVEKITSNTYAGETTYENEQFILLDIYPKTNGTVKVTYGGLTKTITDTSGAEEPNAQQVFFGTFNGVSDSVETPSSGELVIKGQFSSFACGSYQSEAKNTNPHCACITAVDEWGEITFLPDYAFDSCTSLALTTLPRGITNVGSYAFRGCTSLALTSLPSGITNIKSYAFKDCTSLALTTLPSGLTSIESYAFYGCTKLPLGDLSNTKLATIETSAFENCSSMTNVVLPETVTYLGKVCLRCKVGTYTHPDGSGGDDYTLTNVRMLGTTPPTMEESSGGDNGYITAFAPRLARMMGIITVPKGSGQTYKTADRWQFIADQIVEAS